MFVNTLPFRFPFGYPYYRGKDVGENDKGLPLGLFCDGGEYSAASIGCASQVLKRGQKQLVLGVFLLSEAGWRGVCWFSLKGI